MRHLLPGLTAALLTLSPAVAAETAPAPRAADPGPADWRADPVCRMVFFAVLEGLYADGVPDAVVDAVVPRQPKDGANPLKASFVVRCPLCHPVYEAFAAYQRRPAFNDGGPNTFGSGLAPEMVGRLTSPVPRTRLTALAELVQRWVARRLTAMRLTDAEKLEWAVQLGKRSHEGKTELSKLMRTDPLYDGWSIYWGCAACNGSTHGCSTAKTVGK